MDGIHAAPIQRDAIHSTTQKSKGKEMNAHDIETVLRSYLTGDGYIAADDIPAICAAIDAAIAKQRQGEGGAA